MVSNEDLNQRMINLGEETSLDHSLVDSVMQRLPSSPAKSTYKTGVNMKVRTNRLRRIVTVGSAAVFLGLVIGALSIIFKNSSQPWWLHSSAVYAQSISKAVEKAATSGVTAKEKTIIVFKDGTRHTSSTVGIYFVSRDSYRRDLYEGKTLVSRQWYVPSRKGMTETGLQYPKKTYTVLKHKGGFGSKDPISRMQFLVNQAEKANRRLVAKKIEGRDCVGFEISADKYGSNPSTWIDRVWFDKETKLPVRIEYERPRKEERIKSFIHVQEQFNWKPKLPSDVFTPVIPADFKNVTEK